MGCDFRSRGREKEGTTNLTNPTNLSKAPLAFLLFVGFAGFVVPSIPALRLVRGEPPGFPSAVRWLENFERKMDWLHFQGLFKWLAFLGGIVFAASFAKPDLMVDLIFDKWKIETGEVWRIFSFVLVPWFRAFSPIGALMIFFAIRIAILINDSLEGIWGSTRMTLYLLSTWLCLALAQYFFPLPISGFAAGTMFYTSVFLAFTTLFPKVEFLMFFALPVEVRYYGWLTGVMLLINAVQTGGLSLLITIPGLIPYCLWVLPGVITGRKTLVHAAVRRRQFTIAKGPESVPFHVCEVCRRTEHDPADLEFFVMPDGKEYCTEHLPPQPQAKPPGQS